MVMRRAYRVLNETETARGSQRPYARPFSKKQLHSPMRYASKRRPITRHRASDSRKAFRQWAAALSGQKS